MFLGIHRECILINSNIETKINFRFNRLDKLQAFTLARAIVGSSYEELLDKQYYVGYVPLTKESLDDINDYYVRQRIDIADCDIFIVANSVSATNIVGIPTIVNRMLKYIDCKLTFSFTADIER